MKLTDKQMDEFIEASKPLMKWMQENCHPETQVLVDQTQSTLYEGVARFVDHTYNPT